MQTAADTTTPPSETDKDAVAPPSHSNNGELTDTERLRLAMEAGRFGSFSLHLATGEMLCTTQCKANFGLPPDAEFTYDALLALIHPDDLPLMQAAVTRALSDHIDYEAEYRILLPNKEARYITAHGKATYADDGTPIYMVGVTRDVTAQRQNENALRASEASVKQREAWISQFYALTARPDLDFMAKVQSLLRAGYEWLGLHAGVLAHIDGDAGLYSVAQVDAVTKALPVGFTCPLEQTFCSETIKQHPNSPPLAVEHAGASKEWRDHLAYKTFGCEAYHAAVVRVNGKVWGTLAFFANMPRPQPFTDFDKDMVRLMAQWVGGEIAQREAVDALRATVIQQRRFVREMLASVTEGRLRLCDDATDLPDLLTAVGEAGMNAVRHGGGGTGRVHADSERGVVQVWIQDHGKGIRQEDLHRATLEKGWSGGGSLGHGFFLMLRTVDHTYLLTGDSGTTVVLEQEQSAPHPSWLTTLTA